MRSTPAEAAAREPDGATPEAPPQPPTLAAHELRIQPVGTAGYLQFLRMPSTADGHLGTVHIANFHHPAHGTVEAYAKLFPTAGAGHRGLINEVTGWLLADALDLPRPRVAFLANLPLPAMGPLRGWLRDEARGRTTWPAFCTQRVDAQSAAVVYSADSPLLRDDVARWDACAPTVALDERIANTDRHLNNLLRVGPRRYVLIDHDRLACTLASGRDWAAAALDAGHSYDNRLSRRVWNDRPSDADAGRALDHGRDRSAAIDRAHRELAHWAHRLLPATDAAAWVHFVTQRTGHLERLLARRFHRLH